MYVSSGVGTICMWVQGPERPGDSIRSPGAGDAGSCEPPYVDAQNRTRGLCKNSICFQPLSLSSALILAF